MLRFSILSVFCLCLTASSAFGHDWDGTITFDFDGLSITVGPDQIIKNEDIEGCTYENPYNHVHEYFYGFGVEPYRQFFVLDEKCQDPISGLHGHYFAAHEHDDYVAHQHGWEHDHEFELGSHSHDRHEHDDHAGVAKKNTGVVPTPPVVSGAPPSVEESEDTSTAQQVVSSRPEETQPEIPPAPPLQPVRVTEYMVRDFSGGIGRLPQWIEIHNPNTEAVNLKDYTFQYATRRFANHPYKVHTLTLATTEDGFSIAGGGVALLTTRTLPAWQFSGIETAQVYNLNIENVLKRGWVLTDAGGTEIQRIGRDAFSALGDPVAPPHQDGGRVSHHAYRSEAPSEAYYYGHRDDVGSPGFYEQPAPSAPSAVIRTRVGTWASLKRTP